MDAARASLVDIFFSWKHYERNYKWYKIAAALVVAAAYMQAVRYNLGVKLPGERHAEVVAQAIALPLLAVPFWWFTAVTLWYAVVFASVLYQSAPTKRYGWMFVGAVMGPISSLIATGVICGIFFAYGLSIFQLVTSL